MWNVLEMEYIRCRVLDVECIACGVCSIWIRVD